MAVAFGIVVLGVGVAYYEVNATPAPVIVTAEVGRGPVVQTVEATGTVQPVDSVEVGAQVTGTIKTLGATFNSEVKEGQVLATLDPASLQAEVDQARAGLVHLQAQYEQAKVGLKDATVKLTRAQQLSKEQLIANADYDAAVVARDAAAAALKAADAQVVQARASLAQTQVNLTHTIIRSPASGIVLARNVEIGQTVTSGLQTPTLFVIARDLSTMQVSASVDESDIGAVQAGQQVTFSTDAYGTQVFAGTVTEVRLQPVVTQNVVTYTTIISVPNPGLKLKPGMTADVRIETARADDTLRVPTAAIRFRPDADLFASLGQDLPKGQSDQSASATQGRQASQASRAQRPAAGTPGSHATLWKVVDGKLEPIRVTLGVADGAQVGIAADGLEAGTTIAIGVRATGPQSAAAAPTTSPLVPSAARRPGAGR
jgi:HlyD family secretion protein